MLMQLQHPHIVQFYGVSYHDQHYYIVQELCKGSMYDILNPIDQIPGAPIEDYDFNDPKLMITWAAGIARGLAFMHAKSIVHRDLKPQNILLNKSNDALVADLGTVRNTGSGLHADGSSSLTEEEEIEKWEAVQRQMTKGESGTKVLLKTIYNEAMTQMTGTAMYMSPEQFRFTYSYPGKS